ncbi:MAG: hypothetical protein HY297_02770, partial [Thaumarchaeota archaeon]|nr:hypothetical protein [Nitrososphaerota archaeon]
MQAEKKSESKVLDRSYVELSIEGKAGKVTRKEVVAEVAQQMGVPSENVALVSIDGRSGTTDLVAKVFVYGSTESKKRVHPMYLGERMLTKEEREKLKQDRKKAKAP